jgi:hypothetical protein
MFSALILSSDGLKGGLDLTTTICHRHSEPDHLVQVSVLSNFSLSLTFWLIDADICV